MADSKVSELPPATTCGSSDILYIVQSGTSKKITLNNLFAHAGNVQFEGNVNYSSSIQTLGSPGTIDVTKQITHLTIDSNGGSLVIPKGTPQQIKILVVTSSFGGTYLLNSLAANSNVAANVGLTLTGDAVTLLFTNDKWYAIGGRHR
jgi:hypothetical protein